jgi:hypothetical protein
MGGLPKVAINIHKNEFHCIYTPVKLPVKINNTFFEKEHSC